MFGRWALATTLALGVLAMFVDQRHRQLVVAAAAAHERANGLEKALQAEKARSRASLAQGLHCSPAAAAAAAPTSSPPDAPAALTLGAIREVAQFEMRQALLQASTQKGGIAAAVAAAATEPEQGASELKLARIAVREALAAEQPGWCRCPSPPNVTELCASLLMTPSSVVDAHGSGSGTTAASCELRVLRARAEVEALRSAVLEANARLQDASAAAILKVAGGQAR